MSNWFNRKMSPMEAVLEKHRMTDQSVGGFLTLCACGEAVDSDTQHWSQKLEAEGFGDLKPARELVKAWKSRAFEITRKADWMASTGQTSLVTSLGIRSNAYSTLSKQLKKALKGEAGE